MKQIRWFSIGAALLLCLSLFAPLNAEAASSQKNRSGNHKSLVKQDSGKTVQQGKSVRQKKTAHKTGAKQTRQVALAKKTAVKNSPASKNGDKNERALWLKRAQDSEMLSGKASWYGRDWHNKKTASGLAYDMYTFTAAHRTLPMGTVVKVTDQENGKSVMVCVTDRGPFVRGRVIDLSYAAAKQLDLNKRGVGRVALEVVSDEKGAPLKADHAFFVSYPSEKGQNRVGPFNAFADVAAMHEALSQAHPDAKVVLERSSRP